MTAALGVLIVALVIFLAARAWVLWYWKIDAILAELKAISKKLDRGGPNV